MCETAQALAADARGGPQPIPRTAWARAVPGPWWARPDAAIPARITLGSVRSALGLARSGEALERRSFGTGRGARSGDLRRLEGRPAAVLVALFEDENDQASVVLTRRSTRLRSHNGEVAFPGGRLDPGETPLQAARREAAEEIGLDPARVEILGQLTGLSTASSCATITPFVAALESRPVLLPNPAEVERVFTVPLVELLASYHEERWEPPGVGQAPRAIHFYELPGETVWGATAHVLTELLVLVLGPSAPGRALSVRG